MSGVAPPNVADGADAVAMAEEYKQRGNAHITKKEFQEAVDAYGSAIQLNPKVAAYWLNRSTAHRHLQNWDAASEDAAMATERDPLNVKAHYLLALCLQRLRQFDRAMQSCEVGLALQADNKALQQVRAEVEQAKRHQEQKQDKLAKMLCGFSREAPRAPSASSTSSDSSAEGGAASFCGYRPPKKEPRALTDADAPYQELCAAALNGDLDECKRLIESGAIEDLEWKTPEDGNTALHVAADAGHEPVVRALLDARAYPGSVNDFGLNAFALAAPGSDTYRLLLKITRRTLREEQRRNARRTYGGQAA